MTSGWIVVGVLATATYALRLGGAQAARRLQRSPKVLDLIAYLAPAVLAGLVAVATFADGASLRLDSRAAGVAAAAVAVIFRAPTLVVIGVAVVVAALTRQML